MSLQEAFTMETRVVTTEKQKTTWASDGVVDALKDLWSNTGLTAEQIAEDLKKRFGICVTRSAVIGKANRSGLELRKVVRPRAPRPQKVKRVRPPRVYVPKFKAEPEIEPHVFDAMIPLAQRKTLFQITDDDCKYMIGDPQEETSFFCGGPHYARSFCKHHFGRCTEKPQPRRSNRPRYRD